MNQNLPGLLRKLKLSAAVAVTVGSLLFFGVLNPTATQAATGINQQLNFQGRLLDNTGAVVADGSYNMEFKVYQDGTGCVAGGTSPCGGTLKWTEDHIQTNRVTVKNGYFSTSLGSITAFAANIDWNQDTLWLSTNIGGVTNTPTPTWDGEMTAFQRLTASPYALNSNSLQGLQATSFVQLAQGVQTDTSITNPSIFINKNNSSGTPNILELQKASTDVLTVDNSGGVTFAPQSTADVTFTTDNDSNVNINSTFTGTGPSQSALAITLTDNATAAGTSYGLSITNADNAANVGVPAALAYLKNANAAETVPDGLLVEQTGAGSLTSGLEVKQTAGAITNGLTFTGSFSKLINSTNFSVTNAGAGTFGSTLTVNGTTLSLGNGSASTINTPSGNAGLSITPNGSGVLNLATANTGLVSIGNSTGTFQLTSSGGLNVSTGGALTGVSGLDTIATSATGLTFAGAGTIASTGAGLLTLSSGAGSDVVLNSNVSLRPGTDSASSVVIQNSGGVTNLATFGTNTSTPNLIGNPSMENNANGWTKKGNAGVTASSSDDFAEYGSRSLKIVTTATIGDGASYSVPLKASTQYTLSGWVRLSTGTATTLNLNRQDNGSDVDVCSSGSGIAMSVNTTFSQFSCTFTTGAIVNTTTNIYIKQTDGTIRTIYLDGVTMVAGASGLTFDAGGTSFNVQNLNSMVSLNAANSGDIQPWQLSSSPLTTALRYGATVSANGYVYYVGGCTTTCAAGTQVATAYYAKLEADGSLGTWNSANAMPAGRYGLTTLYINGYLYAIGGDSGAGAFGATPQTSVYYTKMNNDGSLGTWQTSTNTLTLAREFQTSTAINGFIYAIGGDNAGAQSTVYYAKAYADGSIGSWSTTTALSTGAAARRYASTITANGYVYVIGGDSAGTAQNTVYYDSINGDGTFGATWSSTTAIAVGGAQNRRHQTSMVLNGYVYVIGGDNGTTAQTTVYYAKLLPDGTIGTWQSTTNQLPAGRYGMGTLAVNGYIYSLGGYDGTNTVATPYYASTERTLIGGSLDLVGLSGQSLTDAGGAGSITAGSIRAVGGLTVDGYADFNNGLSVDSSLNINAVSANTGQTVFNINNFNSNSIFSIRHMNSTFGSLANAGAFIDNMAYMGQEFTKDNQTTATAVATATAEGDDLEWFFKASATTFGYSTPRAVNGIGRIAMPTTTTTSGLLAMGSVAGTLDNILLASNLPVIQMKVATTLNSASSDIYWGVENGTVAAPTTNDTPPSDGFFFWNNNAAGGWQGMVRSTAGGTIGTVNCPGSISTTAGHFATGRIEVLDTTHVHFMIDNDSTDGVNLIDCGTVTGTLPVAQLAPFIEDNQSAAQGAAHNVDIDYARVWQDDSAPADSTGLDAITTDPVAATADTSTTTDNSGDTAAPDQTSPLTNDSPDPGAVSDLIDFAAASSDDTIFDHDVYVQGTIYANKIVANQIEGMDVITDKIDSLSAQLAKAKASAGASPPAPASSAQTGLSGATVNGVLSLKTVQAVNLTILTQLETKGGLVVDGGATFNGTAQFKGQVSFNSDAGGLALIKKGATKVQIKFSKAYPATPIITANYLFGSSDPIADQAAMQDISDNGISYIVTQTTNKGFTILLNKAADEDINFSWLATQIDNPSTAHSEDVSLSNN